MINPAPAIRIAFMSLLNGQISYDGVTVPVYEGNSGELVQGSKAGYKIEIGEQSFFERNTKHSFTGDWKQTIEVITEMSGSGVRKHADAISSLITQLVTPTPNSTGLACDPFQFIAPKLRNITHLSEPGQSTYIVRTILTFSFIINQK